jgi:hypothetical protein
VGARFGVIHYICIDCACRAGVCGAGLDALCCKVGRRFARSVIDMRVGQVFAVLAYMQHAGVVCCNGDFICKRRKKETATSVCIHWGLGVGWEDLMFGVVHMRVG